MEKISEILNHIKERISNPLIFSFICSWLIINWPITVGLIWYDSKQIEHEGFSSIFQFINSKIDTEHSLWHPLLFALGYTILIPNIRNLIRAFYSWTSKWGDKWNLKIIDRGKISIERYLNLRAEHDRKNKFLEEVIEKESSYRETYDAANQELLTVKNQLNDVSLNLTNSQKYMRQLRDLNILNGVWENSHESKEGKGIETATIENGKYLIYSSIGEKEHIFDIRDFYFDNLNRNVFFVKELISDQKEKRPKEEYYNINRLRFEGDDLLVGTENGTTKIRYKRKSNL